MAVERLVKNGMLANGKKGNAVKLSKLGVLPCGICEYFSIR